LTCGVSIAGDVWVSGDPVTFTGGGASPKLGVYQAASEASGVVGCWLHRQNNASLPELMQVQMRCRSSAGAVTTSHFNVPFANPYLALKRTLSGNQVCGYYSADGGEWTQGGCTTVALPTTLRAGVYITGQTASSQNATGTIENVNIHALPKVTRTVATMSAGSINVSADDEGDNESAFSTGASGTPGAEPSAGEVKWHPGFYLQLPNNNSYASQGGLSAAQSNRFAIYDQFGSNSDLEGFRWLIRWSMIEGSQDNYTQGINLIQAELDKLASLAVPKRLILSFNDSAWTGNPTSCSAINTTQFWPSWMTEANENLFSGGSACVWRKWEADDMGEFIKMLEALGAAFNDHPLFEALVPMHETAINSGSVSPPSTYSEAAIDTQFRRLMDAMAVAWPNTVVMLPTNWLPTGTRMINLLSDISGLGLGFGTPDAAPNGSIPADNMIIGVTSGSTDLRGLQPIQGAAETTTQCPNGGFGGPYTIAQIGTYFEDTMQASHQSFHYNVFCGSSSSDPAVGNQNAAILTWIGANSVTNGAGCPTNIVGGCDTN
jgi:hypothetical protein